MMNNKIVKYLAIAAAASLILGVAPAFAQATSTNEMNASINSINSEVTNLSTIEGNESIPSQTKLDEEILAQQTILDQIITLSTNEIASVETELNDLPTFATDTKEYSLESNYMAELNSYSAYFQQESTVVANAVTLSQLETVAANIKEFRDSGYNTQIYNMVTFYLLYYDEGLISDANSRLGGVGSNLTTLDNSGLLSDPDQLNSELTQATNLIASSSALQEQAALLVLQTPLGSSTSTASSTAVSGNSTDPRTLIDQSISDIKTAYQLFIDIATDVKNQLG